MPTEKAPCKCLSIMMLDSVIKPNKKSYPQTLLEECKYVKEKIKIENLIDDDLMNLMVTLMMKQNLIMIMTNRSKKNILITKKAYVLRTGSA